ncbi:hypothetical protein [Gemmiger sp. An194]|uniref:hypothetical protein n=1 Tax=Gemmiger sp. An194 TaxID=1965582 RepID=UPI000B384DCC|nr:hypothetical protein [Gemmiger sp. An194]OUP22984.1 hypothetical protein B5F28_13830 [Gemmiger sp. An194]
MTDLECRALMGDKQAQEECTRKGIVLACPFCGGDFDAEFNGVMFKMERTNLYAHKRTGRCVLDGEIIFDLSDWNTRPAPPVGRCEGCALKDTFDCVCSKNGYTDKIMEYCSFFAPKEGE